MKRILFAVAAAILFVSTFVTPAVVQAEGGAGTGTNCGGNGMCKP